MIDGVALARSGVAFLRENPDIAILHRINASFQLRKLAAEHVEVPVEASLGVRHSQMNVVEAKGFGILQDLDFSAPGVFDEGMLVQPGFFGDGHDDFNAFRFELFHFCC